MSDKSVLQLAEVIGIPLDRLLEQLKEAGLSARSANDVISEDEKMKLLAHLRQRHGKTDELGDGNSPRRVTLKRRQVSSLKQANSPGGAAKTISIEVRKEKTYIKRPELADSPLPAGTENSQSTPSHAAVSDVTPIVAEQVHGDVSHPSIQKEPPAGIESVIPSSELQVPTEIETPVKPVLSAQDEHAIRLENAINNNAEKVIKQAAARQLAAAAAAKRHSTANSGSRGADNRGTATTTDAKKPYTPKPAVAASPAAAPSKANFGADKKKGATFQGADKKKSGGQGADGRDADVKKGWSKKTSKQKGRQGDVDAKHQFERPVAPVIKEVAIPEFIIVSDLAQKMSVKVAEVIKQLMKLGVMATINQAIDQETAVLLVEEMGHTALLQSDDALEQEMLAELTSEACEELPRAPIVTIMGHVDHGKTSLLDYIRKTRVAAGEAGGITQHIGAYQVITDHGSVTFLDTPGHAAFTAMRARGAEVTDVVIVVVAADDGVMPQIIVAINKIDKPGANPEKVMQEMANIDVMSEAWGGDVQFISVSAKTGEGIDDLIEALILQTEILELKAPVEGAASGFVIESRLDRGRGAVATVLIQKGTLEKGQFVLCGHEYGRIRAMFNESGKPVKDAGPCAPVEILGLSGTPMAGDAFLVVQNERVARELASHREDRTKSNRMAAQQATKLDDVFSKMGAGQSASLNLVIKTDVQGSLEALRGSLMALSSDEVEVKVVFGGVGGINESDVNLALASSAIIIGFNVRADTTARKLIEEKDVDLHYYSIIYEAIDEVKKSISGLLAPEIREVIVGLAEVRDVFKSPKFGAIAGCMVIDGQVKRNLPIRVLRNNIVIYEGQLESLRRFKDDAAEVKMGMECGIGVKNYNDVQPGDQIEVFERKEVIRTI
ncbi:MAG: translation initiation factor IF-2 [Methylococcales bacterium]|nr:translation initiation factor IF-2 [Methylococcales bacterium]